MDTQQSKAPAPATAKKRPPTKVVKASKSTVKVESKKGKSNTSKFYSPANIDKKDAIYNVIFGERSNGKTFAILKKALEEYVKNGSQMAYLRRWKEDVTGRRASQLWAGIVAEGLVSKLTNGEFEGVHYYAGKFYLCTYTEEGKTIYNDQHTIGFAFSLTDVEHNKSTSYPNIRLIMFDEFLTSKSYLPNEFVHFMNSVSTIVRQRKDVKIYMLGNTVNKYCPYFKEMGLHNIQKQRQGTIDLYRYGDSGLTVAVEYCASMESEKESNVYFAFDNPKLQMITGGAWELALYPHLPYKYKPKHVQFTYFIKFSDQLFQCEVVWLPIENAMGEIEVEFPFTFIHRKTTELQDPDFDLIYDLDYNPKLNYNRSILKPRNETQKKVKWFFDTDRVFYQDNDVGDTIMNYLKVCQNI